VCNLTTFLIAKIQSVDDEWVNEPGAAVEKDTNKDVM
jgi:hypothetical protein